MSSLQNVVGGKTIDAGFNVDQIRSLFPILSETVHGKSLVYLDNAATTQKPESVLHVLDDYYRRFNSNIHRGVHTLSERATEAYEGVRSRIRTYLNANSTKEIIFVRGTTEAINMVAASFGQHAVGVGDEILISGLEHHSNIVPWQLLCECTGAKLRVAPIDDRGEIVLEQYESSLTSRTKLVAIAHVSNALGTVIPVKTMIGMAHRRCIPVLIDGAQAAPHFRIDVRDLDCDFYALSAHKMCTGRRGWECCSASRNCWRQCLRIRGEEI